MSEWTVEAIQDMLRARQVEMGDNFQYEITITPYSIYMEKRHGWRGDNPENAKRLWDSASNMYKVISRYAFGFHRGAWFGINTIVEKLHG